MSIQLRGLDPAVREAAEWTLQVAAHYRVPVTVTSVRRTWTEQEKLYNRYKSRQRVGAPGFPAARPGYSAHQYGLAWDSHIDPKYEKWWKAVRQYAGFEVPQNDIIHAQYPNWKSLFDFSQGG